MHSQSIMRITLRTSGTLGRSLMEDIADAGILRAKHDLGPHHAAASAPPWGTN